MQLALVRGGGRRWVGSMHVIWYRFVQFFFNLSVLPSTIDGESFS